MRRLFPLALAALLSWSRTTDAAPPLPTVEPAPEAEPVFDQTPESSAGPTPQLDDESFSPPHAIDDSSDWVLMNSGEWLRGTIGRMREGTLEFTSASVGIQLLAWDSVAELYSPRRLIYVMADRSTITGTARMKNGKLFVLQQEVRHSLDQARVLSIVTEETREIHRWAFKISLGVGARSGNTESVDYSSFARLSRVDAYSRLFLEHNGAYGWVAEVENVNKQRGNGAWDLFLSPTFYLTPASGEAVYDKFQNLALRWTVASGFGARALRFATASLKTDIATGYLQNNFASVMAGEPTSIEGFFVRPALQFNWSVTSNLALELQGQSSIVLTNLDYTFHRGSARVSVGLIGIFSLDASVIYDRQETTVTDATGITPRNDDLAGTLGLGIDLR